MAYGGWQPPSSSANSASSPVDPQNRRKQSLFSAISNRPMHLKYAWDLYEERPTSDDNYEARLTILRPDIITVQMFWQAYRSLDLQQLAWKESVHFFKRQIRPVWEDRRNWEGGAWYFRLPTHGTRKNAETQQPESWSPAQDFFESVCMAAVGQHIDIRIKGTDPAHRLSDDDLCGVSLSSRDRQSLISIWNRRGANEETRKWILDVVLAFVSEEAKASLGAPQAYGKNYYYKQHSEHKGFEEVVAKARAESQGVMSPDNEVKLEEREAALVAVMAQSGLAAAPGLMTDRS